MTQMVVSTSPTKAKLPDIGALVAVAAVMLGTFTSILTSRLTDIGLTDLRGALGIGYDEATWITTAYVVAEVAAVPATVWLRMVLSPAPVVIIGATLLAILSLIAPSSPSLPVLLTVQALRGLGAGMLIPMTYGVVMRYIPQPFRLYGLAVYALISGFTPSLSVFAEAWIIDHLSWKYLFWINVIPGAFAVFGVAYGMKWDPVKFMKFRRPDLFGLLSLSLGLAALVAALDQGNHLDWLNSGLIVGLLLAASVLLAAFVVHSLRHPNPMVDLRLLSQRNAGLALSVTMISRFANMSAALVIPQFLIRTQGYRALETGHYLVLAGLPQLALAPFVAWLCYRFEPRNLVVFGAILFSTGVMLSTGVTSAWTGDQFMIPMLMQTLGAPFLAVPVMVVVSEDITFPQIAWIATWVHIVRTVGTAIATAAIGTLVRVQEQIHSNLIGLHIQTGDLDVQARLDGIGSALKSSLKSLDVSGPALGLLAKTVQKEAFVLAYADALYVIAFLVLGAAVSGLLMRRTPLPGRFF
jgi:DHA2 family multidrug resistance protein